MFIWNNKRTHLPNLPESRRMKKDELYRFSEHTVVPKSMELWGLLPKPAESGISGALRLEWIVALVLATFMPSTPDVFESDAEALNYSCVLYSKLKSLTVFHFSKKAVVFSRVCVFGRCCWSHVCLSSYCNCWLCLITICKTPVLILTSQLAAVELAIMSKMKSY